MRNHMYNFTKHSKDKTTINTFFVGNTFNFVFYFSSRRSVYIIYIFHCKQVTRTCFLCYLLIAIAVKKDTNYSKKTTILKSNNRKLVLKRNDCWRQRNDAKISSTLATWDRNFPAAMLLFSSIWMSYPPLSCTHPSLSQTEITNIGDNLRDRILIKLK